MNLTRVWGIILRHIFLVRHQLERSMDMFVFPILSLILWGFLANYVQVQSSTLATFFFGGLILWVIFERVGTTIGIDFMWDVWERNLVNILATPIKTSEYVVALIIVALIKISVSFLAMWLIAAVFYDFKIGIFGFSLAAFWLNLLLFAVAMGIFNISIILRYGHGIGPLTWVLPFAIQPFAAVFYPVSVLPETIQRIVWFLPLTHVFEGMRSTFETGAFNANQFFTALFLNLIYFSLTLTFFIYMFKVVKKKGLIVKL